MFNNCEYRYNNNNKNSLEFTLFFVVVLAQLSSPPQPPIATIYNSSQISYSQQYPYSLPSNSINSNNNNNTIDAQSFYTTVPLNQFSSNNQFIFTSNKNFTNVCHTPSSTSSLSSFDEPPPVKPRLSLRPHLPPPPPPPIPLIMPTIPSSMPPLRGPTRPAPRPPIQIKAEQQQASEFNYINTIHRIFMINRLYIVK